MKKLALVLLVVLFAFSFVLAQAVTPPTTTQTTPPPAPMPAKRALGLYSIGGNVGYAMLSGNFADATDIKGAIAFGARADIGDVAENISLHPELYLWSGSKDVSLGSGLGSVTQKVSDFVIGVNAHYPVSGFYVGGGLGYNSVSYTVGLPAFFGFGGGSATATSGNIGINLLGGKDFKVGDKMNGFVEARYSLVTDVNQLIIFGGVNYNLK